jgi:hypothetical protein
MIEQFISNLFGGGLLEDIQATKAKLKHSAIRPELMEAKQRLRHRGEVYNISRGKICSVGKRLSKNKRCIKNKLASPVKKVKSPKRKSPKRKSPKRKSPKVKSPKRKSKKVKSPKRKSKKVKSPKRKSKTVKSKKV